MPPDQSLERRREHRPIPLATKRYGHPGLRRRRFRVSCPQQICNVARMPPGSSNPRRNAEIHPVPVKSVTQRILAALHRLRSAWLAQRTAHINSVLLLDSRRLPSRRGVKPPRLSSTSCSLSADWPDACLALIGRCTFWSTRELPMWRPGRPPALQSTLISYANRI